MPGRCTIAVRPPSALVVATWSRPSRHPGKTLAVLKHVIRAALAFVVALLVVPVAAGAAGVDVISVLQRHDAYVSPRIISAGHAHQGDSARLDTQARTAAARGVPEKFVILSSYPSTYANASQAADALRNTLSFSGVLVLVAPGQIALSSGSLTQSEMTAIARQAAPRCGAQTYTDCALFAGRGAVSQVAADHRSSSRSTGVFWLIVLAVLAVVGFFAFTGRRRRSAQASAQLADLRRAADATLAQADAAVRHVEDATRDSRALTPDARSEYDRALALREAARDELARGSRPAVLMQANQDAAHAVLALQGVMRSAGIQAPLSSPLDAPLHRCFYCGRSDRPPYKERTISDEHGNSMQVEVCAVDEERLEQGQRPQVATVQYQGSPVPWYAVPGNPWYYAYGGPVWQYWLPFFVGMDIGGWFGGGGGPGWGGGGGWDSGWGGDPGSGIPADAGQADFGGGWDTGSGFDGGGADFGGGGDSGGGGWS